MVPAYFVLDRRWKSVSARSSSARRGAIRSDLPPLRSGGKLTAIRLRGLQRPAGAGSSGRERAKRRPRVIASRSAYASRGSVGL